MSGWITGDWPSQADTQNWPSLYLSSFCFEKNLNICTVITAFWSPLEFASMYIIFGEQSHLGKRGFLLKILTCKMPSPDLWSFGMWGLVQTWVRRAISMLWSLSVPRLVSRVWGLVMSVCEWLLFPAPGCLRPAGLVACILVSDYWSDPKRWEIGPGWGLFNFHLRPSSNFLEEK